MPPKKTAAAKKAAAAAAAAKKSSQSQSPKTGKKQSASQRAAAARDDDSDHESDDSLTFLSPARTPKSTTKAGATTTKKTGGKKGGGASPANDAGARLPAGATLPDVVMAALSGGTSALANVVTDVIDEYRDDANAGIATVVSVICRAAGVPDMTFAAAQMPDTTGISTALDEALVRMPATVTSYPLIAKDDKKFKKAYPAFFHRLTEMASAHGLLNDETFLETLVPWITAMAESRARNFRHAASVALFEIVQVVSDLIKTAQERVSATRSRKDAAEARAALDAASMRYTELFPAAFHNRCKDVCNEIRLLAFQTLRTLILSNPALHVANRYLRYLAIALNDKRPEIRLEGLDTIVQVLGTQPESVPRMRQFLEHFAARIVEMAADVDTRVADLALKVATLIVKADKDVGATDATLSDELIDKVLAAVADDRAVIRTTAGTLLKVFIRCRVDSVDANGATDATWTARHRAETLCHFALTLRANFHEARAEAYIVDALWGESPPPMLTAYNHYVSIAIDEGSDPVVSTALRVLAAILQRLQGRMDLGPVAKDDLKPSFKKGSKKDIDEAELAAKISTDVSAALADILDTHNDSVDAVTSVAMVLSQCDVGVFASSRMRARLNELLGCLRRISLAVSDPTALAAIGAAWRRLALTESAVRSEAETQLQQTLRAALKALKDLENAVGRANRSRSSQGDTQQQDDKAVGVWRRIAMLSSLVPLTDHWGVFTSALTRAVHNSAGSVAVLEALIQTLTSTVLWQLSGMKDGGVTAHDVGSSIGELAPHLLSIAAMDSERDPAALRVRGAAVCALQDLIALPFHDLTSEEQAGFVTAFVDVFEQLCEEARELADVLKDHVRSAAAERNLAAATAPVTEARRRVSQVDALLTRLAAGAARLFTFQRIEEATYPRFLTLWTKASSVKPAAESFKTLFHVLRDRHAAADVATIERHVLIEAAKQCAALGGSPSALDTLYQIGMKLASMHFVPNDKYYPAVPSVVKSAIEHAKASMSEMVLHGASAFCCRLRVADALSIANNIVAVEPMFTEAPSPYARAFVSAIRRAAKLESGPPASARKSMAPLADLDAIENADDEGGLSTARRLAPSAGRSTTKKRAASSRAPMPRDEEDDVLASIVADARQMRHKPAAAAATPAAGTWRGRGAAANASPRTTQQAPPVSQAAVSTLSSMLGDDEVFVATQEWN